jgi:hypothetical protein
MRHEAFVKVDVLTCEREAHKVFYGFSEPAIDFLPTAPIDPANAAEPLWVALPDKTPQGNGTTRYSGRILFRSQRPEDIECTRYEPYYDWCKSGHRPVSAVFHVRCVRPVCSVFAPPPAMTASEAAPVDRRIVLHVSDVKLRRGNIRDVPADADIVLRVTSPGLNLFEPTEITDPTSVQSGQWVYHDIRCVCQTHCLDIVERSSVCVTVLQVHRAAAGVSGITSPTTEQGAAVKVLMSGAFTLGRDVLKRAVEGAAEVKDQAKHAVEVSFPMQRGGQFLTVATLMISASVLQSAA